MPRLFQTSQLRCFFVDGASNDRVNLLPKRKIHGRSNVFQGCASTILSDLAYLHLREGNVPKVNQIECSWIPRRLGNVLQNLDPLTRSESLSVVLHNGELSNQDRNATRFD